MSIKVSIIIPAYNVEEYIEECIESAINQTIDNIEIVAINDGSTDNTLEILRTYEEKYGFVKVINQENKGVSIARNRGLEVAKGEYIYFLDSDDYIDKHAIEYCYGEAKNNNLDILTFDANNFKDSKLGYDLQTLKEDYDRRHILYSEVMSGEMFYNVSKSRGAYRSVIWINLYKTEFLKENNIKFYEGIIHEDELFCNITFVLAKRVMYIPKVFFYRRIRINSIMNSTLSEKNVIGVYTCAEELYKFYNKNINKFKEETKNNILNYIKYYYNLAIRNCNILNLEDKLKDIRKSIEVKNNEVIKPINYLNNNKYINKERYKTVSLCMIVKDEEKYLEQCLDSVKDIVDEIIIIDTGSTDNTVNIAKKYTNIVKNYKWRNSFSKARNYSISKAKSDWILIMDADEEFNKYDYDRFIDLINSSDKGYHNLKILNYKDEENKKDITQHYTLRLIRNNKQYEYEGDIHEYIVRKDKKILNSNESSDEDITLFHYGYTQSVRKEKDKTNRNIPLIKNKLSKDPNNILYKVYLANEYFAINENEKALEIYNEAYKKLKKDNSDLCKCIVLNRLECMRLLEQQEELLKALEDSKLYYPEFIDLEYINGNLFYESKQYEKAIESFEKCIEIGKSPTAIQMFNDFGTYKAQVMLSNIYEELEDYEKALDNINKALRYDKDLMLLLYKAGEILNKIYKDKHEVGRLLSKYFRNLNSIQNLGFIISILLKEELYDVALDYVEKAQLINKEDVNIRFLKGKTLFYKKNYEESFNVLYEVVKNNFNNSIDLMKNTQVESVFYLFLSALINSKEKSKEVICYINKSDTNIITIVYNQIYELIYEDKKENICIAEHKLQTALNLTKHLKEQLIKVEETELANKIIII